MRDRMPGTSSAASLPTQPDGRADNADTASGTRRAPSAPGTRRRSRERATPPPGAAARRGRRAERSAMRLSPAVARIDAAVASTTSSRTTPKIPATSRRLVRMNAHDRAAPPCARRCPRPPSPSASGDRRKLTSVIHTTSDARRDRGRDDRPAEEHAEAARPARSRRTTNPRYAAASRRTPRAGTARAGT